MPWTKITLSENVLHTIFPQSELNETTIVTNLAQHGAYAECFSEGVSSLFLSSSLASWTLLPTQTLSSQARHTALSCVFLFHGPVR